MQELLALPIVLHASHVCPLRGCTSAAHAGDWQHLEVWPGGRARLLCHRAAVPAQPGQRRPPRDLRRAVLRNRPLPVRVRRAFMCRFCCAPALCRFPAASAACCLLFMLSSIHQLLGSPLAGRKGDQPLTLCEGSRQQQRSSALQLPVCAFPCLLAPEPFLSMCSGLSCTSWGGATLGCRYASHILEREPGRSHHTKSAPQTTKKSRPSLSSQQKGGHQGACLEPDLQGDADAVTAAAVAARQGLERRPSLMSSSVEDENDVEYW